MLLADLGAEVIKPASSAPPTARTKIVRWLRIYRRSTADSTATSGANLNDLLEQRPTH
jgi:crotonobetainyl-CoA:carnitine CoA-transferase CaiB-like acyl-CoA transferase